MSAIKVFFIMAFLIKEFFHTMRTTGTYETSSILGEPVGTFVPYTLLPRKPTLSLDAFVEANLKAELALARLSGLAGLVPSVDWLLHSAMRIEALLTSQIEGAQETLADLLDD
jgi:Fic/DOC family N-terminal